MAYQSLYRKYRPQRFSDVVGQGHVTRTLQNALASGRTAHGYLFTGTRGTAKTTVARLLAKALNCESTDHPVAEPCNVCSACKAITQGSSIDVIEMDAASHRGVADIEEVRKSVGYGPMELRYKVFIIDEAHQLSSDAKDAFLKTLEEPPDNVVFILATTEPQAIPITIRSRCQQFDFKRGSLADIATRLRYVLEQEGVTYEPSVVNLVARGAEGSYRDSLSLLEQVLAFAPTHVTASDVETVLGSLDTEMLARVTDAVARRDAPLAFALAGELLDAGKEARTLLRTLSLHFRDLLLVSVGGPVVAQELTPDEVAGLQIEAARFTPPQMMRAMELLNEAQGETRWNNQHRLLVELTFLKLMTLGDAPPAGKEAPPASVFATAPIVFHSQPVTPPTAPTPAVVAPPPVQRAPVAEKAPEPTPRPATVVAAPAAPPAASPVETPLEPVVVASPPVPPAIAAKADDDEPLPSGFFDRDAGDDEDEYTPPDPPDTETLDMFGDEEATPVPEMVAAVAPNSAPVAAPLELETSEPEETEPEPEDEDEPFAEPEPPLPTIPPEPPADEPEEAPEVVAEPPAEEAPFIPEFDLDNVLRCWPEFLRKAGGVSMRTRTLMLSAHPTDVVRDTVEITFRERSAYDMMTPPKNHEFVRELLKRCLGVRQLVVHFRLGDDVAPEPPRKRSTEKKRVERDPIKALDSLDEFGSKEQDAFGGFGGSSNSGFDTTAPYTPAPPRPAPAPPPRPAVEPPAPSSWASNGNGHGNGQGNGNGYTPRPRRDEREDSGGIIVYGDEDAPLIAEPAPLGFEARKAAALEVPLVQDVLSVFGGEIEAVDG